MIPLSRSIARRIKDCTDRSGEKKDLVLFEKHYAGVCRSRLNCLRSSTVTIGDQGGTHKHPVRPLFGFPPDPSLRGRYVSDVDVLQPQLEENLFLVSFLWWAEQKWGECHGKTNKSEKQKHLRIMG
jgi:hypothetical protein